MTQFKMAQSQLLVYKDCPDGVDENCYQEIPTQCPRKQRAKHSSPSVTHRDKDKTMTKARIPGAPLRVVDTGWAWAVAAASCFCLFFTCGFAYSTGVYYVIFLETFGAGKGKTAWISSLNFGILCAVGPISSLLINNISCRFSVFIGGIFSSAGLLMSAFCEDVHTLFITFGIITGAGFGLVFTACVVVISEYFVKYRVIAMGLSISGTGLGTIVYPWLSRWLIHLYGWRGALILSAGINAHVCIASLVMRPNRENLKAKLVKKPTVVASPTSPVVNKSDVISTHTADTQSLLNSPESQRSLANKTDVNSTQVLTTNSNSSFSQGSVPVSNSPLSVESKNRYNISLSVASLNNSIQGYISPNASLTMSKIKKVIHDFDLDIFKKPTFILITINTFLFCFGMSVMYTHISAYAASVGLPVSARDSLISSIGFTNLMGRVVLGLAAQCIPIDATWLFIGAYFLAGLGVSCCALWTSFTGLLICVCTFGFFSAGFGPLLSEVTCLAVGVMKFSMAYGYLMVFMAGGTLIGAPIAGALYDCTKFYQGSFYLGGASLVLSSAIMLIDVVPSRWKSRNYTVPEERTVYVDEKANVEDFITTV